MDPSDSTTHTFIVRLWMEDPEQPDVRRWRGHITHLIDEQRSYVQSLNEIADFFGRYLTIDGVEPLEPTQPEP